jgi:hypothetical protein
MYILYIYEPRSRRRNRLLPFLSSKLVEVRREQCAPRLGHATGNLVHALNVTELQFHDVVGIARSQHSSPVLGEECPSTRYPAAGYRDGRRDVNGTKGLRGRVEHANIVGICRDKVHDPVGSQHSS